MLATSLSGRPPGTGGAFQAAPVVFNQGVFQVVFVEGGPLRPIASPLLADASLFVH